MNYVCPYCGSHSVISSTNREKHPEHISIGSDYNEFETPIGLIYEAITCPNPDCKKINLKVQLNHFSEAGYNTGSTIHEWVLLPESSARPQPSYIPKAIVEDYTEACRIQHLSPKASATLARRALQGMIRDFFKVHEATLYKEIDAIKALIPLAQWQAIDSLRKVGNIGAHMEADVNEIIDIDSSEVTSLITFLEFLFEQWYVKRNDDNARLEEVKQLAGLKKSAKHEPEAK